MKNNNLTSTLLCGVLYPSLVLSINNKQKNTTTGPSKLKQTDKISSRRFRTPDDKVWNVHKFLSLLLHVKSVMFSWYTYEEHWSQSSCWKTERSSDIVPDPSLNGHLHYPNDMDRSPNEVTPVEMIVRLVTGLVVSSETRGLVRHRVM